MKYSILFISAITAFALNVSGQESINSVLSGIEKNNPLLQAARTETDAEKIGNTTGLYPGNPEAGFNYLWGNPDITGNRRDFSIVQSFDFPSAYHYRSNVARLRNDKAELVFQDKRKQLLYEAYNICSELIYRNALNRLLSERLDNAGALARVYKRRFETGDANIMESNKAQINLLSVTKQYEMNEISRNDLISRLTSLNGGREVVLSDTLFPVISINTDFEKWYAEISASTPALNILKQEVLITQKEKQLNSSLRLPQFSAGYMSEVIPGEEFKGVTVGMSIPLWQNKNTVKYAKARTLAAARVEEGNRQAFYNSMKAGHTRVLALRDKVNEYREVIGSLNNTALLGKALDSGQISLSEYLIELAYYYDAYNQLLEMEYELQRAYSEISRYQL